MADTRPLTGGKTVPMNGEFDGDRIQMLENIIFTGHNGIYEILTNRFMGMGGESQVYMARRLSDGEMFAAKVYDQFQDNKLNRINRQKAIDFVLRHSNYRDTHILPLVDYGMVDIKSDIGDDYRKPIDILPICETDKLNKVPYEQLRDMVIPGVLKAMQLLHGANIVHRDIKPGNIYMYSGTVVLADFGTACEIMQKADYIRTTTKRGTLGYTAPEVWAGYAVTASDFFSLGCTLATLYKGEHVYQRLIDMNDEGAINKAISSNGLPLNCSQNDRPLQVLVNALAAVDESKRAGYDDVALWLEDPETFERKFNFSRKAAEDSSFSFHFEDIICHNEGELIKALSSNWEIAKNYLYRGGVKNSALVNFFSKVNQSLAIKIGEIIEARPTATNYDLGLAQTLHYIGDGGPLYWRGQTYNKLSDISNTIRKLRATEDISTMFSGKYVSWKLEKNGKAAKSSIEAVKKIENVAAEYPKMAAYMAMYILAGKDADRSFHGIKDADSLFENIMTRPYQMYQKHLTIIGDDEMLAYLAFLGYLDNVLAYRRGLRGSANNDLELFYRLFESVTNNKAIVREHYIRFGPQSYLWWLKGHMDLYQFNSEEAKRMRSNILGVQMSNDMSVDQLSQAFMRLKEYQKDFRRLFQDNILLAYLGIGNGKDKNAVTSNNSDAFFVEEFCGNEVPVGYMRYLQMQA